MTTNRSYRRAMPLREALAELSANAGTQFDPQVVHAVVRLLERSAQPGELPSREAIVSRPASVQST